MPRGLTRVSALYLRADSQMVRKKMANNTTRNARGIQGIQPERRGFLNQTDLRSVLEKMGEFRPMKN